MEEAAVEKIKEVDPDELLSQEQFCAMCRRRPKTVEGWRSKGTGPRFATTPNGRFAGYPRREVSAWLQAQTVGSTAEARARKSDRPRSRQAKRTPSDA